MISLKTKTWRIDSIETILFDKDGTFIDLHYFWGKMTELRCKKIIGIYGLTLDCLSSLCECLGYDIKSGKMLADGITALYSRSKIIEIFKQDLLKFGLYLSVADLESIFDEVSNEFYQDMISYTKPIDSAINFIKELRAKGLKIGIVTSDSEESTKLTLKNFSWEYLFDVYVGREASLQTKESGALTKIALDSLKANPETTVMIGDAPMDYISAKNAGIKNTILVATGQIDSRNLLKTCDKVVNCLSEIEIIH